jgi:exonuclease SbcD
VRILHTSDWHLGRSFHGEPLLPEQGEAVDRLVALTSDRDIDLVLIAGDLYDRAIPPSDAVRLFDSALVRLREAGASIVAVTGNHDSPSRVAVADRILERAGVAIRGDVSRCVDPLQFDPGDGGPPVSVFAVPYLEPSLARPVLDLLDIDADTADRGELRDASRHDNAISPSAGHRTPAIEESRHAGHRRVSHHDVTELATKLIRRTAAAAGPTRSIVVAHTFVDRGKTSESERDLSVGNIDRVGLNVFDGFDYVALGHLHRSQTFDSGRIAYSGSPLPYSFSEESDTKSVRIIEMNADGHSSTEVVPLGVGRPLRTLRGRLEDLLEGPEFVGDENARVRVRLTDPELPLQAMTQIQRRFPHAAVLEHVPDGRESSGGGDVQNAVESSEDALDLALRFWADQHGRDASSSQRDLLSSALEAATDEHDA